MRLYVATGERLGRIDDLRAQVQPEWALDGSGAQCLAVDPNDPDVVFVGCRGGGLWRSDDGGRSWERLELPERDVFSVAVSAADGAVYAGSEPSRLFCSDDGGRTFHELTAPGDPVVSDLELRRGRGRRTFAGSPRTRTTPIGSWSGSSSAG